MQEGSVGILLFPILVTAQQMDLRSDAVVAVCNCRGQRAYLQGYNDLTCHLYRCR